MQALDVEVAPQGHSVDPACLARLSRDDLETMIALLEKAQLLEASGAAELADGSPGRGAQAPNQRVRLEVFGCVPGRSAPRSCRQMNELGATSHRARTSTDCP